MSEVSILARPHLVNLHELARMPRDPEYITPQEVLVLLRIAMQYDADFTVGLEPRRGPDENVLPNQTVRIFEVMRAEGDRAPQPQRVACRVRKEPMVDDPDGVWIPDANIVWAHQMIGKLLKCAGEKLELLADRRLPV